MGLCWGFPLFEQERILLDFTGLGIWGIATENGKHHPICRWSIDRTQGLHCHIWLPDGHGPTYSLEDDPGPFLYIWMGWTPRDRNRLPQERRWLRMYLIGSCRKEQQGSMLNTPSCDTIPSTLWWTNILPWKITIFHGKIHYFYGHFQLLCWFTRG